MAIKLRSDVKRTEVRPEFWAALSAIGQRTMVSKMGEIQRLGTKAAQQRAFTERWPQLKTIKTAMERNESMTTHIIHSGWEYITGQNVFDQYWLVFAFSDVICTPIKRRGSSPTYYLGDYMVYVPEAAFSQGKHEQIHFVPQDNPLRWSRHPHHYIGSSHPVSHPLLGSISTCYGGYGDWIKKALRSWHIVDLMTALRKFLLNYTPGDTLVTLNERNFPNLRVVHE